VKTILGLDNSQKEAIGLNFILRKLTAQTPYGTEYIIKIEPYRDAKALESHFDNIEKLMGCESTLENLRGIMAHFKNIRGILTKCEGGTLNEIDLFETKGFLLIFARFLSAFKEINADIQLSNISFTSMSDVLDILDPQKTRITPFSLQDFFCGDKALLPGQSHEVIDAEEIRIMAELSYKLRAYIPILHDNIENLGALDITMAKAALAVRYGAVRPKINQNMLMLKDMTNPMVAASLEAEGHRMTSVTLTSGRGVAIITGANMGGKSVAIKTAALNAALCGLGLFVFAYEAEIPLFDGIFLISQDLQNIGSGLSSFGGEVSRLNALAARLKQQDFLFVALDEPARATNPAEGAAIVRSVAAWLAQSGCVCLLSTHYDGVTAPNARYYRVAGLSDLPRILHENANISDFMDYRLIEVDANEAIPKDALKICRLLGLDIGLLNKIEREYINTK